MFAWKESLDWENLPDQRRRVQAELSEVLHVFGILSGIRPNGDHTERMRRTAIVAADREQFIGKLIAAEAKRKTA